MRTYLSDARKVTASATTGLDPQGKHARRVRLAELCQLLPICPGNAGHDFLKALATTRISV
ncbi:MAG: hypothetical protein ACRD96_08285, partial [Bryobacteraceae bacterium]